MHKLTLSLLVGIVCWTGLPGQAAEPLLKVGDQAPDFTLQSMEGQEVQLSKLIAEKPTVLVFSRAHWCPYCMGHMQALQKQVQAFDAAGGQIVAVFRENKEGLEGLKKVRKASKAEFLLLDDPEKQQTKAYSPEGYAAYVIDQQGIIRGVFDGTKTGRPDAEKLLAAVKSLKQ